MSGDTVVVGDFDANIEDFGTVDVFVKPANGWSNMTQTATLSSSDNGDRIWHLGRHQRRRDRGWALQTHRTFMTPRHPRALRTFSSSPQAAGKI